MHITIQHTEISILILSNTKTRLNHFQRTSLSSALMSWHCRAAPLDRKTHEPADVPGENRISDLVTNRPLTYCLHLRRLTAKWASKKDKHRNRCMREARDNRYHRLVIVYHRPLPVLSPQCITELLDLSLSLTLHASWIPPRMPSLRHPTSKLSNFFREPNMVMPFQPHTNCDHHAKSDRAHLDQTANVQTTVAACCSFPAIDNNLSCASTLLKAPATVPLLPLVIELAHQFRSPEM